MVDNDGEPGKKPLMVKKLKKKIKLTKKLTKGDGNMDQVEKVLKIKAKGDVIQEVPIEIMKIGDTDMKDRLPAKEDTVIKAHILHGNRQAFVQFINTLFYRYKSDLKVQLIDLEQQEVHCASSKLFVISQFV